MTSDVLVFACFFSGVVVCLGMSATFHVVLDHSQEVARWGNKLGYMGIVALIVGSYVPALYYGFVGKPALFMAYLRVGSLAFTGRDSNITVINSRPDLSAWCWVRHYLVRRAVSHPSMAITLSYDVRRPWIIWLHPHYPRRHYIRLQSTRA